MDLGLGDYLGCCNIVCFVGDMQGFIPSAFRVSPCFTLCFQPWTWGVRYLYHMLKFNQCTLPAEALKTIRLQSFSLWHEKGAYSQFEAPEDAETLKWVKELNMICSDLGEKPGASSQAYYAELLKKYNMDGKLKW